MPNQEKLFNKVGGPEKRNISVEDVDAISTDFFRLLDERKKQAASDIPDEFFQNLKTTFNADLRSEIIEHTPKKEALKEWLIQTLEWHVVDPYKDLHRNLDPEELEKRLEPLYETVEDVVKHFSSRYN